ncbi:hypothetical protein NE237_008457 [Protea cynaroides]|uniref:Uncharacterized protein n=1 Tax=Protea cynaroides TaxID=273540 RepID=A0A9Q0KVM8_9MAGN|nr:hypothetical protein NE237_008457 [Protea cynaroides]
MRNSYQCHSQYHFFLCSLYKVLQQWRFGVWTVVYVVLLLAFGSVTEETSKYSNGWPCMLVVADPAKNQIRKLLHGKEEVFKGFGLLDSLHGKDVMGWDLRKVPTGPDPLHHNGNGPKKPRTP